jgi:serine/threonine-protein kinase RsbW
MPPAGKKQGNADAGLPRDDASAADPAYSILHIQMASRREAVSTTVDEILKVVEKAGLTEDQRANFAVAVTEALSNAVVHGNGLRSDLQVQIVVTVVPGNHVSVEVKDSGPGFDASAVADPTEPSRVLEPGGRGVFLMLRLVDRAEYNRSGNCVRLTMFCAPKG